MVVKQMDSSSLYLAPSTVQRRSSVPATSPAALTDVVPFEAALQRLFYEKVRSDEQLASYSVQQAYRGLLYAVRAASLTLHGTHRTPPQSSGAIAKTAAESVADREGGGCVVRGWQAVLYRLACAATRSADDLDCAVFLSVRILCDRASAHGEGNERPCCTAEWTAALLRGLPLDAGSDSGAAAASPGGLDAQFAHLVLANRRYQLGYLVLVASTLRMVASGQVEGHHLCCDYGDVFHGAATDLLPRVARCVEESLRETAPPPLRPHASQGMDGVAAAAAMSLPSRMSVELNHFVLHVGYWLTLDVLRAHMQTNEGAAKASRKRPLILDRDLPRCLWGCVTLVRNALRRGLSWLQGEAEQVGDAALAAQGSDAAMSSSTSRPTVALLVESSQQLEGVFTDLLKHHEHMENALLNARRQFSGVESSDVRSLVEMQWAHTLQMCFLLRSLTGVWVSVHGGLGYGTLCGDQLLPSYRDVLMFMASALLRIPSLEAKQGGSETEQEVFLATEAALCALLTLVSAAPTSRMQAELWSSDGAVTQQVHGLLVQRALRYRHGRVLKLSSLLSRGVLDAAVQHGALAGFAADSADQLLELLESDDDAASRCVGELLSVAVLQHPYRLVPALFRLLRHGNAATRRHVLQVLTSLPDVVGSGLEASDGERQEPSEAQGGAATPLARRREVLRLLAENLLLQLQDEELCVRMLSSSLFAKVHPSDVLQPLLNLSLQRDDTGRKRSAAAAALTSVMAAHTETAATFLLLLQSGYECHQSIRGAGTSTSAAAGTTGGVGADARETASGQSATVGHRPTPHTPGDILSQALLYSPAGMEDEGAGATETVRTDDSASSAKAGGSRSSIGGATPVSAAAASSGARRKEGQLHSLLLSLTDQWVRAAVPYWAYSSHSCPLLQCLAESAGLRSTGAAPNIDVEDAVQFTMKYILRASSVLTAEAVAASLSLRERGRVLTSHLLALWTTFFSSGQKEGSEEKREAAVSSLSEGGTWSWQTATACSAAEVKGTAADSARAKARVHAALLPLLCLRSCAPDCCAVTEHPKRPETIPVLGGDDTTRMSTDAIAASLASGDVLAIEKAQQDIVMTLWSTLWSAVADPAAPLPFFAAYPDVQRVVLEVLSRFPAGHFFAQWTQWSRGVSSGSSSSIAAHATAPGHTLLVHRVYLFAFSAYLAAGLQSGALRAADAPSSAATASQSTPVSSQLANLEVALQHRQPLLSIMTELVPQWLMEDSRDINAATGSAAQEELEATRQRLCMAAVDATAVVGLAALSCPQRALHSASTSDTVNALRQGLMETSDALLRVPLEAVAAAYRSTAGGGGGEADGADHHHSDRAGASDSSWTALLTRLQLCLRAHASLLRAVAGGQPREAAPLLLLWFRHFLRVLVEVANAACRSDVGRPEHDCRAAVDACGAVFQAVLMARKLDDADAGQVAPSSGAKGAKDTSSLASPAASATSGSALTAPMLCRLAYEEKDALVNFSVGCTRFAASPAVQVVGVRLLSSLLVAAPEVFLEISAKPEGRAAAAAGSHPANVVASSAALQGVDALQSAVTALQSIALMHADRSTRLLAEEVLRMIEKACASAGAMQ